MTEAAPRPDQPQPSEVPPEIMQLAAERGLGDLGYVQRGGNPVTGCLASMAYAAGWLIAMILLGWWLQKLDVGPLGILALPFLSGAIWATVKGFRRLFAGVNAAYLFFNGLVCVRNGRTDVITWPEIDKLVQYHSTGKLLRYFVVTRDGRKVRIEAESGAGDMMLGAMLTQAVQNLGRPVQEVGPSAGRSRR
jgi:hypothetical protein